MDDDALLARWIAGDRAAAEALIVRHFKLVHRFIRAMAPDDADELTQRTFLAVLEGAHRVARPDRFRAYLFGIARNQLLRLFQERRPAWSLEELSRTPVSRLFDSPTSLLRKHERRRELWSALQQLSAEVQLTLQLHYWAELSVADIAAITEVAEGTVRSRLTRGRQELHGLLAAAATSFAETT